MNKFRWLIGGLLSVAVLALSGCSVDVVRNSDGSLTVTQTINEASLSDEMARVLENDHLSDVAADLHDGYITVAAKRTRDSGQVDNIAFRIDLSNANGKLSASISEFTVNGNAASDERIAKWNEKIAKRLERGQAKHPNRTLESITITDSELSLVWYVIKK